jgi:hypothetical protein
MNRNKSILIILLVLIWSVCQSGFYCSGQKSINIGKLKDSRIVIDGSIGIITTSDKYEFGDTIVVLDGQKQFSKKIVITTEYKKLTLKCLSNEEDYFKILLEDKTIGYLPKNNPLIRFQTWKEHILSVFAVGFDSKKNPIKAKPNNQSIETIYDQDEFYYPFKIQGDWLQIKWGTIGSWQYGWIKWKENNKLIIELFYFA